MDPTFDPKAGDDIREGNPEGNPCAAATWNKSKQVNPPPWPQPERYLAIAGRTETERPSTRLPAERPSLLSLCLSCQPERYRAIAGRTEMAKSSARRPGECRRCPVALHRRNEPGMNVQRSGLRHAGVVAPCATTRRSAFSRRFDDPGDCGVHRVSVASGAAQGFTELLRRGLEAGMRQLGRVRLASDQRLDHGSLAPPRSECCASRPALSPSAEIVGGVAQRVPRYRA